MTKLRKLLALIRRPDLFRVFIRSGVAASVEHIDVLRSLTCASVVDVGANRGQFSLIARYCFPVADIFSFEPLNGAARRFHSLFKSDHRVFLFNSAIGPSEYAVDMHVSERDDSSSLLPITERQNALFPGTAEAHKTSVKVARLATLLADRKLTQPCLLKLDVQGFELQALHGCESCLHQVDSVYVECSFMELYAGQALADEIIEWLGQRAFRLQGVYNVSYDASGVAVQADFLFRRAEM